MCSVCSGSKFTRREFVQSSGSGAAVAAGLLPGFWRIRSADLASRLVGTTKLETAIEAARWIAASRIVTDHGVVWPANPADPGTVSLDLYHGSSGVILFLLELYSSTENKDHLMEASAASDCVAHAVDAGDALPAGLYTGLGGMGVALTETYRLGGDAKHRDAAVRCFSRIRSDARQQGNGVTWDQTTDIISGSAGIGLALLYAGESLGLDWPLELSVAAGRRLTELGREDGGGLKWPMSPDYERLMPNFAHGTAGVGYFLATLYEKTGKREFLDAALAGGLYLQSIADTADGGCLVFHHEPGGEDLYYLSWCHGPAGTARFFYRLAIATGDDSWMTWVHRCAHALVSIGVPERRTPGFWNNVSQCCGDTGVGEFSLALLRRTGDPVYWRLADAIVRSIGELATTDAGGTRWVQAEHRTQPELLVAQTGFMQGAAGVCSFLLHMDCFERGMAPAVVLPDNPFV